jgi:hypothetical protein
MVVTQREVTKLIRSGYDEDRNDVTYVQCAKRAREVEKKRYLKNGTDISRKL